MQKSILIVGGGTAGWMAANLFRKAWPAEKVKITLIESPTIGIIGVGEGSTPQLKSFMDTIGVDEQEWMSACDATYKLGIRFEDWSTRASKTSYFHPFPAQTDDFTLPDFMYNAQIVRKGIKVDGHPDRFFLAPRLVDEAKSPFASENFPFEVQYGYHFDSHKLGEFLKSLAILRGVDYQQCDVEQVLTDDSGITSIIDKDGHAYSADFYVDASGFNSLLLQKALGVGFVSFKSNLFNDSAVVLPTPRQSEIQPQTLSKALSAGWMWSIPLRSRTGNGYVYSSDYLTAEQAEAELRKELDMESSEIKARHIKMNVGRVERNWEKNCVAIGLSQGFIEPLEATALHLVYDTIAAFIQSLNEGGFSLDKQNEFNQGMIERFEGIRDYIVAHYKVNSRVDTPYWRDNANNDHLSRNLYEVLNAWMSGKDMQQEIAGRLKIDRFYAAVSWCCLLAGYGIYPERAQLKSLDKDYHNEREAKVDSFIARCAMNYRKHEEVIRQQTSC